MSNKKGYIIGIFVYRKKILSFIEMIKSKYGINFNKIYVYSISDNDKEYLVTFKVFEKDKYIENIRGSRVMHVKNGSLFSINALNKLIETEYSEKDGKSNNEIEINWDLYKNKLILLVNGTLNISDISKIEDKSYFFT